MTHLVAEVLRRYGYRKKFPETTLHVIAESGHKHAGDTARVFDEMRKELRTLGSHVLGTLTLAGKDECDPLMLADILAHGTFAMEVEGDNGPTEGDSYRRSRATGWTQLKFTGDGLATLKTKLIDGLSRGGVGSYFSRPTFDRWEPGRMIFSNARSIAHGSSSASTSRAMSRKRWYSAGSSGVMGDSGLGVGIIYTLIVRPNIWVRERIFRWLEPRIQAAATERILLYHHRLIRDGFIPDPPHPYKSHSSGGDNSPPDHRIPFPESRDSAVRARKGS